MWLKLWLKDDGNFKIKPNNTNNNNKFGRLEIFAPKLLLIHFLNHIPRMNTSSLHQIRLISWPLLHRRDGNPLQTLHISLSLHRSDRVSRFKLWGFLFVFRRTSVRIPAGHRLSWPKFFVISIQSFPPNSGIVSYNRPLHASYFTIHVSLSSSSHSTLHSPVYIIKWTTDKQT
jgi:hypothetical protein